MSEETGTEQNTESNTATSENQNETVDLEALEAKYEASQKANAKIAAELRELKRIQKDREDAIKAEEKARAEKDGNWKKQAEIMAQENKELHEKLAEKESRFRNSVLKSEVIKIAAKHTVATEAFWRLTEAEWDLDGDNLVVKDSAFDVEDYAKGLVKKFLPGTEPTTRKTGTGVVTERQSVTKTDNMDLVDLANLDTAERQKKLRDDKKLRDSAFEEAFKNSRIG